MPNQIIVAPTFSIGDIIQSDGTLKLSAQALKDKADLLAESATVTAIPTEPRQAQHAINVSSRLAGLSKQAEKDREEAKRAFWAMCCAIDATKKGHVKELDEEMKRLNGLVGQYEAERERKALAEQEERNRKELALIEEQREHEAEAKRIAEEAAKKAAKLAARGKEPSPAEKAKALAAELEAEERAEALVAEQKRLEQERIDAAERDRKAAPSGVIHRHEITIVGIPNLHEVYRFNRSFVRLELDKRNVDFAINSNPDIVIPGLKFIRRPVVSTKAR